MPFSVLCEALGTYSEHSYMQANIHPHKIKINLKTDSGAKKNIVKGMLIIAVFRKIMSSKLAWDTQQDAS